MGGAGRALLRLGPGGFETGRLSLFHKFDKQKHTNSVWMFKAFQNHEVQLGYTYSIYPIQDLKLLASLSLLPFRAPRESSHNDGAPWQMTITTAIYR